MYLWNTEEGGPCVLRPIPPTSYDAPNPQLLTNKYCAAGLDTNGQVYNGTNAIDCKKPSNRGCRKSWCDPHTLVLQDAGKAKGLGKKVEGPWYEGVPDAQQRHNQGWDNQFGFPYEIGLFWNLTVGGVAQRAVGCPGLDEPFGTVSAPNWPYRNNNSPIFGSPAMQCDVNTYAPEGRPMHEIVEELASDNELFAEKFLASWQQMTSNGNSDLEDGPQNGWLGHYSLSQQGVDIPDFDAYITENAPVTFTDPKADPWICGHRGHAGITCGIRFSKYFELAETGTDGCVFKDCKEGGC